MAMVLLMCVVSFRIGAFGTPLSDWDAESWVQLVQMQGRFVKAFATKDDVQVANELESLALSPPLLPLPWSYDDPGRWAETFSDCRGSAQSPIDIPNPGSGALQDQAGGLMTDFVNTPVSGLQRALRIINDGHAVQLIGNFGTLNLPDGQYDVQHVAFHFPSEHKVMGQFADGEMHIVTQKVGSTGNDNLAVIGIFLDVRPVTVGQDGLEQSFLMELAFGDLPLEGEERSVQCEVDLVNIFRNRLIGSYWHYRGSLTTPPCSETVHWYLLQQHAAVTQEIVNKFKAIFPNPMNNRPVQLLGSREVVDSRIELTSESEFER